MKKSLTIVAAMLTGLAAYSQNSTNSASTRTSSSTSTMDASDMAGKFGAGITLGEPIGGTVKYFLTDNLAFDGAIGWSSHDHTDVYFQSDVLWNDFDLIKVPRGAMPVYFGVGPLVRLRNDGFDNQVGIRGPVGVSYFFDNVPVEIFGEIGPALDFAPNVRGELTGGVGVRFWF